MEAGKQIESKKVKIALALAFTLFGTPASFCFELVFFDRLPEKNRFSAKNWQRFGKNWRSSSEKSS